MTTHTTRRAAAGRVHTVDAGLELSVWDALMVGRVSANRPGLRARTSDAPPDLNSPVTSDKEVI